MTFLVKSMNKLNAREICKWKYEKPYDLYNLTTEDEAELLEGSYYSVHNQEDVLIGFYCFGSSAKVPSGTQNGVYDHHKKTIDIGLGLKPDLCSSGLGKSFLLKGIEYAKQHFHNDCFRLTVASFNKRAISVYEKVGFRVTNTFNRINKSGQVTFKVMYYENK